jgi:hypothetical protein
MVEVYLSTGRANVMAAGQCVEDTEIIIVQLLEHRAASLQGAALSGAIVGQVLTRQNAWKI